MFLASPPRERSLGMKSLEALRVVSTVSPQSGREKRRGRNAPEDARMPKLLELEDRPVALDDLGANTRLTERGGRLGQAEEAVELRDDLEDRHPRRVVLVELAVELQQSKRQPRGEG